MNRRISIPLFIAFLLVLFQSPLFAVKSLIRLEGLSKDVIRQIVRKDYDIAKVGPTFVEMVVTQGQVKKFLSENRQIATLIPDLDKYISGILAKQRSEEKYFTYQTMTDTLKAYVEKYPKICRLESIGKSCENRDIWGLKISDYPEKDEKEPSVLIMGAHHAREWISFEVPLESIKQLLEGYGKDDHLTKLVNEREIWFVPMVNPDGVNYSQNQSKYWRKNRRKNSDNSYGVDPNRNYGYQWGVSGSSSSPGADTYKGPKAFSEPETCAIRDLAKRENFSADISFHSYSELILYPWSYAENVPCEHRDIFVKMGTDMAKFNDYIPEVSSDLYPSAGDTDDYLYGVHKSLSFTFELGTTFIPDPKEIGKINAQNVPAVLYLIDKAGTYGLVTPTGGENIENLNTSGAIAALLDLDPFAQNDGVADRIKKIQQTLAMRIVEEHAKNETTILSQLKSLPGISAIQGTIKLAEQCKTFVAVHDKGSHQ